MKMGKGVNKKNLDLYNCASPLIVSNEKANHAYFMTWDRVFYDQLKVVRLIQKYNITYKILSSII